MAASSSNPPTSLALEGLRQVLNQQYLLHEDPHHQPNGVPQERGAVVAPVAHTLTDIYKCLHQGIFGIGHNITSPDGFRDLLARDLSRPETRAGEPILETVAADGSIVRLNLRPYRQLYQEDLSRAGEILLEVCLESAGIDKGSLESFWATLAAFRNLNNARHLGGKVFQYRFPPPLVLQFLLQVQEVVTRSGSIPVLSHSPVYRRLNAPSYRVVDQAVLEQSPLAFLLTRQ